MAHEQSQDPRCDLEQSNGPYPPLQDRNFSEGEIEGRVDGLNHIAPFAMNLGIPAITIGGGGQGSGAHSLNETYDSTDSWKGTERALLLVLSLAQ